MQFFTLASNRLKLLLATGVLLHSGCSESRIAAPTPSPPKVVCVDAVSQPIVDHDEFVGRTDPAESVDVRARVSGFLETVDFTDGSYVEKDQLLATIEAEKYKAIHDQSLARIVLQETKRELAKTMLARSKKLIENGAVSEEEYDQNVAALDAAEAEIVAAQADAARTALDVKYTEIKAPIAGRIDRALVTPGNIVSGGLASGTLLTRIVNDSPIYAYVDVDEATILRYIRKEALRQENLPVPDDVRALTSVPLRDFRIRCELQLNDEVDFPHIGVLDFLENRVDSTTGTIRLRGVFENKDRLIRGGLFVRMRIPTSETYDAVMIPETAIGTDQTEKFAYIVNEENQAMRRTLTLGERNGPMRIIKEGIKTGEQVIVQGIQRVRPDMIVDPQTGAAQ